MTPIMTPVNNIIIPNYKTHVKFCSNSFRIKHSSPHVNAWSDYNCLVTQSCWGGWENRAGTASPFYSAIYMKRWWERYPRQVYYKRFVTGYYILKKDLLVKTQGSKRSSSCGPLWSNLVPNCQTWTWWTDEDFSSEWGLTSAG